MSKIFSVTNTAAPASTLLIRIMVGAVFLSEGIQKFLHASEIGAGRFARIGLPAPEILGPFVGGIEIVCGTLVLLGMLTRLAVLPLLIVMATALVTTKLPILVESGFWKMAPDAPTNLAMTLGSLFLLMVGAGPISWDARRTPRGSTGP